MRSYAF